MLNPSLVLLSSLCLLLILVILLLILLIHRMYQQTQKFNYLLLRDQRQENQLLRNQLRALDVPTLGALNHVTLPSNSVASSEASEVSELASLGESIEYEVALAEKGYSLGDLSDDFESQGWTAPVLRRDPDGGITAFDPS